MCIRVLKHRIHKYMQLASRWHACGGDDVQSAVLAIVVTIVALILLVDRKSAFYLEDTYYNVIYVFE